MRTVGEFDNYCEIPAGTTSTVLCSLQFYKKEQINPADINMVKAIEFEIISLEYRENI